MTARSTRRPSSKGTSERSYSTTSEAGSSQVSTPSYEGSSDFMDGSSYGDSPVFDDSLSDYIWENRCATPPWTPPASSCGEPTPTISSTLCSTAQAAYQNLLAERNYEGIEALQFRAMAFDNLQQRLNDPASAENDEAIVSVLNICAFEVCRTI